jgi:hypothetical protein
MSQKDVGYVGFLDFFIYIKKIASTLNFFGGLENIFQKSLKTLHTLHFIGTLFKM